VRRRTAIVIVSLVCAAAAGCGGGDKPSPKAAKKDKGESSFRLPANPPQASSELKQRLERCVRRWNTAIGHAAAGSAHETVAKQAHEDPDGMLGTVTVGAAGGKCIIVVSQGSTVFTPFSRVKRDGAWVASCRLAGAKADAGQPRRCTGFTLPLARRANAVFSADGHLKLRVVSA
jgi:hypothetical protein